MAATNTLESRTTCTIYRYHMQYRVGKSLIPRFFSYNTVSFLACEPE